MLQPPALCELLHLLEDQRRLVTGARVFVTAAHLRERGVALLWRWVPMHALPLRAKQLTKRIARRQADADAIRAQPLDRRGAQVLRLTDAHARKAYGEPRGVGKHALALSPAGAVPRLSRQPGGAQWPCSAISPSSLRRIRRSQDAVRPSRCPKPTS